MPETKCTKRRRTCQEATAGIAAGHAHLTAGERVDCAVRKRSAIPCCSDYLVDVLSLVVAGQPAIVRNAFAWGSVLGCGNPWSGSRLLAHVKAPILEWPAIVPGSVALRERLSELPLVDHIEAQSYRIPTSAGLVDRHGFLCEYRSEQWTIHFTCPVSVSGPYRPSTPILR
jgi:hypothetical protein